MQHHPVICQHAVWGSKQQRFRHCKLPAKLSTVLLDQIKAIEFECFQDNNNNSGSSSSKQDQQQQVEDESRYKESLDRYLELRTKILQPEYDAQRILCGHHQKEAQAAQALLDQIEKEKEAGTYQDPEEVKRLSKEQSVDPKDIPKEFLEAVERVFSKDPSSLVKDVLDQWDRPEEWKMMMGHRQQDGYLESDEDKKEFPCHESYQELFADAGAKKKRHLAQESQLIQSMVSQGLLNPIQQLSKQVESEQQQQQRRPVFVEFGAGTGGLSRHLQLVLQNIVHQHSSSLSKPYAESESESAGKQGQETTTRTTITTSSEGAIEPFNFILLDRQKFRSRNQVDYMIRTQPRPVKPRLLRITKDVRELELKNLQLIHETEPGIARVEWIEGGGDKLDPQESSTKIPTHYICISKHFCGPATDLALAWMREQMQNQKDQPNQKDFYSICFATCCHGICEPSLVVSKPYLKELFNATAECTRKRRRIKSNDDGGNISDVASQQQDQWNHIQDEEIVSEEQLTAWIPWIIKLTGWATLGKQEESSLVARPGKDAPTNSYGDEEIMTRDQRRVLGKRCKKLLDMARCIYLIRECGFKQAKSIEYTEESVESGAIVGTM
ncbi:tRNA:m(4)X modification enzyme TRM13 [Haplosporangium sp. Z 27]|nr:tRNA:m(4)X modification enzyme TRM13 [Haplosporangium sp. Z 27]